MRRGSEGIYNRNYDAPAPARPNALSYNTAHVATLSPFAQILGHLGRATDIYCHPCNCPVIVFAPAHYIPMPVTPAHSATRQVGVAVIKRTFFPDSSTPPVVIPFMLSRPALALVP
jgi:hypothetical protein